MPLLVLAAAAAAALAQWEPDYRLTRHDSASHTTYTNARSIAVSGHDVHVAWYDWRGGWQGDLYYKRSTDNGVTWSGDTRMSLDPAGSYNPTIAATDADVHLVWHDHRHMSAPKLYHRRSTDNGLTWSGENRLTEDSAGSYNPSVWASGNNVHIAWENLYYTTELYCLRSEDRGATWKPKVQLTSSANYSAAASITAGDSSVHLVWTDFRDHVNGEVYYKRNLTGNIVAVSEPAPGRVESRAPATIVRGILHIPAPSAEWVAPCVLLDASGRRVMLLWPGANDVSRLAPGVYFVTPHPASPASGAERRSRAGRDAPGLTKVIVQR